MSGAWRDTAAVLWQALRGSFAYWSAVNFVNFSYVPFELRLIFGNVVRALPEDAPADTRVVSTAAARACAPPSPA